MNRKRYYKPQPRLEFRAKSKTFSIRWLHSKYGNFIKDKIYVAEAHAGMGKDTYVAFRIKDEDGDLYEIKPNRLDKDFIIIDDIQEKQITIQ